LLSTSIISAHVDPIGDATKLLVALMACLLGYGEVGLWLTKEASKENGWVVIEGNPFKKWIEDYAGQQYQNAVKIGLGAGFHHHC